MPRVVMSCMHIPIGQNAMLVLINLVTVIVWSRRSSTICWTILVHLMSPMLSQGHAYGVRDTRSRCQCGCWNSIWDAIASSILGAAPDARVDGFWWQSECSECGTPGNITTVFFQGLKYPGLDRFQGFSCSIQETIPETSQSLLRFTSLGNLPAMGTLW